MTPIPLGILDFPTGAAGAYDLLETQVLSSSAASVTFTGLGSYSDYKHLQIRLVLKDSGGTTNQWTKLALNGDTGSNYSLHVLEGYGTAVSSAGYSSLTAAYAGQHPGAGVSDAWGVEVIDILDFSSSNKNTTTRTLSGYASSSSNLIQLISTLWVNTAAVTSIAVSGTTSFITGSRFSLYGVK